MVLVDVLLFKDPDPVFFRIRIRLTEKSRVRNTGQDSRQEEYERINAKYRESKIKHFKTAVMRKRSRQRTVERARDTNLERVQKVIKTESKR